MSEAYYESTNIMSSSKNKYRNEDIIVDSYASAHILPFIFLIGQIINHTEIKKLVTYI